MKVTAQELRIGNYVWYGDKDLKIDINVLYDIDIYNALGTEGVLLTEKWLLKFGFEKLNRDIPVLERKNLIVEWLFERWTGRLYYDAYNSIQIIELKYVHQLQNLYFALCGEELTIET